MAYAITNTLKALFSRAHLARATIADATLTSTQIVTVANADLGADLYTRGAWQLRIKTVTSAPTAVTILGIAAADDSGFATNKAFVAQVPLNNGNTIETHFTGLWEREGTARYFRPELVAGGNLSITLDFEVVGVP